MKLFIRKDKHLGIDIGAHSIKAVCLEQTGDEILLRKAAIIERPLFKRRKTDREELMKNITTGMKNSNINADSAVSAYYDRSETIRYITIPNMPEEDVAEALKWKLKDMLSYPIDKAIIDYITFKEPSQNDGKEYQLIAIAANLDTLNEQKILFKNIGLKLNGHDRYSVHPRA